ncbi:palmitoyltransferase ZDHHC2/15/20 [Pancytospora epiphaga]|nr:palmitoyltransferase ZDHHC2/15/20 [Pancytospora epiphaga]
MTKSTERCERVLLFTTLLFIYVCPNICYVWEINNRAIKITLPMFIISAILSILYAILCLCFRGYLQTTPETNIFTCANLKGCTICMRFKPERTHHCSRCKRCVRKMDHHCHWLGRCINYDNLGHFVRFLFFTCISTALLFLYNAYYIVDSIWLSKNHVSPLNATVAVISTLITVLVVSVTSLHCYSQFRMISHNTTYIEVIQRGGFRCGKDAYNSIYDMGLYDNLVDVFGSPYFLFLGMPDGDGINFRRRPDVSFNYDEDIDSDLFEHV